ncbi:hypothetical protein C8J98_104296 [Luteibacter sp. OK325]|nr:hypothetical protein C8J98_104296 [Luteibacter sp. OK325]
MPIHVGGLDQPAYHGVGNALAAEFGADADWPVTLPYPATHEGCGEAVVILIALVTELRDGIRGLLTSKTATIKLLLEFAAGVLAPGQEPKRLVVRGTGGAIGLAVALPRAFIRLPQARLPRSRLRPSDPP